MLLDGQLMINKMSRILGQAVIKLTTTY